MANHFSTKALATTALLAMAAVPMTNAATRAQEAPARTVASQIQAAAVAASLRQVTANGTQHGAADTRVHILPTITGKAVLPHTIKNRNNFYNFDPGKALSTPVLNAPVPGIDIGPNKVDGTAAGARAPQIGSAFPAPAKWYPADLSQYGGQPRGVAYAQQVNIYINCPAHNDSCWGNRIVGDIPKFENNLSISTIAQIADQYVGTTAKNRYPASPTAYFYDLTLPTNPRTGRPVLLDSAAQAIAAAAASSAGGGYTKLFHVFLPNGTDSCFDSSYTTCYSPTYSPTFYYCGYHGSFTSTQHVLYSVEPYDYVNGCRAPGMSPLDAQVSVLSHEIMEAITDPDPNTQWNNYYLGEIGDECAWNIFNVKVGKANYNIQLEYSNKSHACNSKP